MSAILERTGVTKGALVEQGFIKVIARSPLEKKRINRDPDLSSLCLPRQFRSRSGKCSDH
jgi:hypothetical protein